MKYCSNCGAEVNENAAICLRCGYALKKQESTPVQPAPGGKASMVLGIISIVFAAIGFFLTICVQSYLTSTYEGRIQRLATNFDSTKIGLMILFLTVPGILSLVGFILGLANKGKNSSKTAGIVLNAISLILCVIMFIIIQGL